MGDGDEQIVEWNRRLGVVEKRQVREWATPSISQPEYSVLGSEGDQAKNQSPSE